MVSQYAEGKAPVSEVTEVATGLRSGASLSDRVRSLRLPNQTGRGTSRRAWLPWLLCALLTALSVYFAYQLFVVGTASAPPAVPGSGERGTTGGPAVDSV